MGEIADDHMNSMWEEEARLLHEASLKYDEIIAEEGYKIEILKDMSLFYVLGHLEWVTQQGERLKIQDMSDDHITNCLNHLNKQKIKSMRTECWIEIFTKESSTRQINGTNKR